jgi:hypothetical protein
MSMSAQGLCVEQRRTNSCPGAIAARIGTRFHISGTAFGLLRSTEMAYLARHRLYEYQARDRGSGGTPTQMSRGCEPKQRAAKSKAVILATLTADVEIGFGGETGCKFFCELPS